MVVYTYTSKERGMQKPPVPPSVDCCMQRAAEQCIYKPSQLFQRSGDTFLSRQHKAVF